MRNADKRLTYAGATAMTDAYSDDELESMMADLESDRVERKESLQGDSPARIREAVCAFANGQPEPEFQVESNRVHCTVRAQA